MEDFKNYIPDCSTSNIIGAHNVMIKRQKQLENAYALNIVALEQYKNNVRKNRNIFVKFYQWIKRVLRL